MSIEVKVTDGVSPWLRLAATRVKDWKQPLRTSGAWMFRSFMRQFRAEGIPRWKALAQSTLIGRIGGVKKARKLKVKLGLWASGQRQESPAEAQQRASRLKQRKAESKLSFYSRRRKASQPRMIYLRTKKPEGDKQFAKRMSRGLKRRKREGLLDYKIRQKAWRKRHAPETFGQFQARAGKRRGGILRALHPKILQDTGKLRRTYTTKAGAGSVYNLEAFRLSIGSQLVYSAIHQRGGWSGKGHRSFIPSRPLNVLREDRDEVKRILERHVMKAFNR